MLGQILYTGHKPDRMASDGNKQIQVRDPVERFISRFNYNRWRPYNNSVSLSVLILSRTKDIHWEIPETTTSKFCLFEHRTQLNTHLLTYLFQETLWTRTLGCLGQSFTLTNKGKEEGQIWLPVSLTSCLSASIRFAVESYIFFQYLCSWRKVSIIKSKGTVPQNQRLYRADSQVFHHLSIQNMSSSFWRNFSF